MVVNKNFLDNDEELVDNAMYGASLPNYYYSDVPEEVPQMKDPESADDNTPMKRNVCYAPTLIGDGRYSYISWSNLDKSTEYNNVIVRDHESPNDDI